MDRKALEKQKNVSGIFSAVFLATSLFSGYGIYESYSALMFFKDFSENKRHVLLHEFGKECRNAMNSNADEQAVTRCAEQRTDYSLSENFNTAKTSGITFGAMGLISALMLRTNMRQYKEADQKLRMPDVL